MAKFDHIVKYDGVFYQAGTDVPVKEESTENEVESVEKKEESTEKKEKPTK